MKNQILTFLLGIFITVSLASTTSNLLTVKPASPKYIIVQPFPREDNSVVVSKFINKKIKEGWLLKEVEGANYSEGFSTWIVVMEKY